MVQPIQSELIYSQHFRLIYCQKNIHVILKICNAIISKVPIKVLKYIRQKEFSIQKMEVPGFPEKR